MKSDIGTGKIWCGRIKVFFFKFTKKEVLQEIVIVEDLKISNNIRHTMFLDAVWVQIQNSLKIQKPIALVIITVAES